MLPHKFLIKSSLTPLCRWKLFPCCWVPFSWMLVYVLLKFTWLIIFSFLQESVKKVENSSPFFCQDCVCSVLKSGVNFCLRGTFNQMKNDHKSNKSSSYGELLTKDTSVTIHHRNIRALAIEIYKVMQGISRIKRK